MPTHRFLKISLATMTLGLTFAATACPPGVPGMFPGAAMPMPPIFMMPPPKALNLDDAQEQTLFALMQAHTKTQHAAMRAADKSLDALQALARAKAFDPQKARALAEEHGRQIAELSFLQAQSEAQMRAVLTDEQRQRFDELTPGGLGGPGGNSCRMPAR